MRFWALAFVATATAQLQKWAGVLNFAPYAYNQALNVTVNTAAGTASFEWVYDVDGQGRRCSYDLETGLKWTVAGNQVTAQGTGRDPSYYSFSGTIVSPGVISGDLHEPNGAKSGTWTAQLNAPQVPSSCGQKASIVHIWPLPKHFTKGSTTVGVVPKDGFFVFNGGACPSILGNAFNRYSDIIFQHRAPGAPANPSITGVTVSVQNTDESYKQLGADESYTLSVPAAGGVASITAATIWGALYGLETFSQLVDFNFDTQSYVIDQAPWDIDDAPRFPHRGLMIDSARHFEPLTTVKHVIDSLPYAKLNVLHWHMPDTQSFPLEIKSHPKLWDGAFSPAERYIQADVADLVEYAHQRGVRVFVEFDMPGHAGSWCKGYPEICPSAACTEPLNVANNNTFTLIEDLMLEMTGGRASVPGNPSPGLFKDNFIHLGGDEVNTNCWSNTPAIAAWMRAQGFTADQAYAYFVKKVAGYAISQGHRPVQWSEVFDHFRSDLPKETIIHIWKSVTNVTEVVALGYQVLRNVGYFPQSWYLDNLNVAWDAVYSNEPCVGVPDNLCPLVIGGHGEMWGETVDASDIDQTVWPRLGAIAERLWSPRATSSIPDAHNRIETFRCLLNRRGIAAAPVNNANARQAPPRPGSCYDQ